MQILMEQRTLVPFPGPWSEEERVRAMDWPRSLLQPGSNGYLLHAGAGSGKSTLLGWLADHLPSHCIVIGPMDLTPYRGGQANDHLILYDLVEAILESAATRTSSAPSITVTAESPASDLLEAACEALTRLSEGGFPRTILLFDDFHHIHPWAAVSLANHLRVLFERKKENFSFVLSAESDLDELRNSSYVYSPLTNVSTSYQLLDFDEAQTRHYAEEIGRSQQKTLTEDDLEALWLRTLGYPSLVQALLEALFRERDKNPGASIADAERVCHSVGRAPDPMRTAIRRLEEVSSLNIRDCDPAKILRQLLRKEAPDVTNRGVRMLLAMGTLAWLGGKHVGWRSPLVQSFWEDPKCGLPLIQRWTHRPAPSQEGRLRAEGQVFVSLFLDLGDLVGLDGPAALDTRRGTEAWCRKLQELSKDLPRGPFVPWRDQARLANLGHDLDLFRQPIVERSFTPIYQASTEDVELDFDELLRRFGSRLKDSARKKAKETLAEEWQRWNRVRLQWTRDGAIHVTLIRDLTSPVPLLQILDEVLGLERELDGGELLELSVQWELALATIAAFVRQASDGSFPRIPKLFDLVWQGFGAIDKSESIYPLRDRYVVYLLRKLCNCTDEKIRTKKRRTLVNIASLEPLRSVSSSASLAHDQKESYLDGCEIACLLEGVMIRASESAGFGRFPELKLREVQRLLDQDLSSWQNELFTASLDSAVLVYQATDKIPPERASATEPVRADQVCGGCGDGELRTVRELHFPQRRVRYEDYWECLTLGLQYVIELRWGAQWIARSTTRDLGELADLMETEVDSRPSEKVTRLVQNLALTTRLLSHLRDASIPLSIAGAGYAARKYEHLIETSGLRGTIENAEKNIEGLNSFLNHHESQRTQRRAQVIGNAVSRAGGLMALVAILVTIPSMWTDFAGNSSIWNFVGSFAGEHETWWQYGILMVVSLSLGIGVFQAWRFLKKLKD